MKFLTECMSKGISEIDKIILLAEDKMKINQEELTNIDKRKAEIKEQNKELQGIIFNFVKKSKQQKDVLDPKINFDNLEQKYQELIVKTLGLFKSKPKTPLLARQIMDSVGNMSENQIVYNTLLWLEERKFITRNQDGAYMQGKNYSSAEKEFEI